MPLGTPLSPRYYGWGGGLRRTPRRQQNEPLVMPNNPPPLVGQGPLQPGQTWAPNRYVGAGTPFSRGAAFYGGMAEPQLADLQQQQQAAGLSAGLLEAGAATQAGYMQEDYANRLAQLGLQDEALALQLGALPRNREYLNKLLGLSTTDYERTGAYLSTLEQLAQQALNLEQQGFTIDERSFRQAAGTAKRNLLSEATGRGATQAPGVLAAGTDIQQQLVNQLEGTGLSRQQSQLQFQEQRTGLQERRGALGTGYEREQLGLGQKLADIADIEKELDLRAKDLGLTREQYRIQLGQGLAKLNLDKVLGVNELMSSILSGDFQAMQLGEWISRQATTGASQGLFGKPTPTGKNPAGSYPTHPSGTLRPSGELAAVNTSLTGGRAIRMNSAYAPQAESIAQSNGLRISSGYRDPAQNKKAGGVARSAHLTGMATDFVGSRRQMESGARQAKSLGARKVLIHDSGSGLHLHVEW